MSAHAADDFAAIAKAMEANKRGYEPLVECPTCEGGGWAQVYSPRPPAFAVCPSCFNPEDHPCP